MPDLAVTLPDHAAATTVAPTAVGELPPDVLADSSQPTRYAAGAAIGEGGMGVVRACVDRRIGREVAMKSVRPGDGSRGDLKARFLREACVQGQLEHPAIVPVYDLGRDAEGTLYFTMKRVRGSTFERIVDSMRAGEADANKQYTRRKLLSAFCSVCHAIDFAHARGVLHRDLKPGNVMLGDYGEVYVLDWGLAKVFGVPEPRLPSGPPAIASGSDPGAKTVHGATLGTPGYMAPEQVRGEEVDARADVYALGAILFELLALVPMHPQGSAESANASTLRGVDARPGVRAPERDVPPELDAICEHATALDRADRTPNVRDIVKAVEQYLDGDRDLAQRRALAREHAARANVHAQRAFAATDLAATEARSLALREVGRAIALDPTQEDAVRTLLRLMTEPPPQMPAEARTEMERERRRTVRMGSRMSSMAYLTWFACLPLMLWMGLRDWRAWGICSALVLLACAWVLFLSRRLRKDGRPSFGISIAGVLAIASMSAVFGPFVIVPSVAIMGSMFLQMAPTRAGRAPSVVLYCLAVAVPFALESAGVLPRPYDFQGGMMIIRPGIVSFPAIPTQVFLLVLNIGLIVLASAVLARFRTTLSKIERRLHVQTWQLRQLVPDEARAASAAPAPPESRAMLEEP